MKYQRNRNRIKNMSGNCEISRARDDDWILTRTRMRTDLNYLHGNKSAEKLQTQQHSSFDYRQRRFEITNRIMTFADKNTFGAQSNYSSPPPPKI